MPLTIECTWMLYLLFIWYFFYFQEARVHVCHDRALLGNGCWGFGGQWGELRTAACASAPAASAPWKVSQQESIIRTGWQVSGSPISHVAFMLPRFAKKTARSLYVCAACVMGCCVISCGLDTFRVSNEFENVGFSAVRVVSNLPN